MEVQHDQDALINLVWKCLLCNLQQLQCLFVKTITGYNNNNNNKQFNSTFLQASKDTYSLLH